MEEEHFVDPFSLTPTACIYSAFFSTCGSACGKYALTAGGNALLRLLAFILLFVFNALGMSWYVVALSRRSAFQVGVLTFALGFIATGVIGSVVFNEPLSLQWVAGSCSMVVGIGMVVSANPSDLRKRKL